MEPRRVAFVSPVLANIALNGLEQELLKVFPKTTRWGEKASINFIRYADDFVITGRTKELLEDKIKPLVEEFMRERGLELSQEKTVITHIEEGFDFLGQNVRKYGEKLLIKPAKKNVKTFLDGIRAVIKDSKQMTTFALIMKLNLKIRGWAMYHRHVVSKHTFSHVDNTIYKLLWSWARRRHPKKGGKWLQKTYFTTTGGDNHRFFAARSRNGQKEWVYLISAAKIPIQRHTKIKSDANPYDPEWEIYFEQRLGVKMEANLRGRRQLSRLWQEQKGICPVCNQIITKLTGWHNHHIVKRVMGGSHSSENRVLLHPECHRQVHSQNVSVSKPRPVKRALLKA